MVWGIVLEKDTGHKASQEEVTLLKASVAGYIQSQLSLQGTGTGYMQSRFTLWGTGIKYTHSPNRHNKMSHDLSRCK